MRNSILLMSYVFLATIGCGTKPALPPPAKDLPNPVQKPSDSRKKLKPSHAEEISIVNVTDRAAEYFNKILADTENKFVRMSSIDNDGFNFSFSTEISREVDHIETSNGVPLVISQTDLPNVPFGLTLDIVQMQGEFGVLVTVPDLVVTENGDSLSMARKGAATVPAERPRNRRPVPEPPEQVLILTEFSSSVGKLAAYITPDPKDGQKHPAIIWLAGGDSSSIDASCWESAAEPFDLSGAVFRESGIVTMYPSLRGGNENPGRWEAYFGELDDVIAAADYLAQQPYVDAERIYLAGHSTGGTLALLVAEYTDRFRAVLSIGPVSDVTLYGTKNCPFNLSLPDERRLRAPILWTKGIRTPTWVVEGSGGNIQEFRKLQTANANAKLRFLAIEGLNHFSVLGPANRCFAEKLLRDRGPSCEIVIGLADFLK